MVRKLNKDGAGNVDALEMIEALTSVLVSRTMSWRDLAHEVGCSPSTFTRMKAGHLPRGSVVVKLLNFLDTHPIIPHQYMRNQTLPQIIQNQRAWSAETFGTGRRTRGICKHIESELAEIQEADPNNLEEWIDVAILALDGAWRTGASPDEVAAALVAKQQKNRARQWPAPGPEDMPTEHIREKENDMPHTEEPRYYTFGEDPPGVVGPQRRPPNNTTKEQWIAAIDQWLAHGVDTGNDYFMPGGWAYEQLKELKETLAYECKIGDRK